MKCYFHSNQGSFRNFRLRSFCSEMRFRRFRPRKMILWELLFLLSDLTLYLLIILDFNKSCLKLNHGSSDRDRFVFYCPSQGHWHCTEMGQVQLQSLNGFAHPNFIIEDLVLVELYTSSQLLFMFISVLSKENYQKALTYSMHSLG